MIINSDGTIKGTEILTDDGHKINGVINLILNFDAEKNIVYGHITILIDRCNIIIKDKSIIVAIRDEDGLLNRMEEG